MQKEGIPVEKIEERLHIWRVDQRMAHSPSQSPVDCMNVNSLQLAYQGSAATIQNDLASRNSANLRSAHECHVEKYQRLESLFEPHLACQPSTFTAGK